MLMEGNLQHAKENVFFIVWMSKVLGSCLHAQGMLNTCISYSSAIVSLSLVLVLLPVLQPSSGWARNVLQGWLLQTCGGALG